MAEFYTDVDQVLDLAKKFLRVTSRPYVEIGMTKKGYRLIDPRDERGHYSLVVCRLYRKIKKAL